MKDSKRLYGTLRFNNMIPVPESEIINFDLNDEGDFKYKLIVFNELFYQASKEIPFSKRVSGAISMSSVQITVSPFV